MINLTTFAPEDFKEHLSVLENLARFNRARNLNELHPTSFRGHYLITGNEGVGKSHAVAELFDKIKEVSYTSSMSTTDAISLFDTNEGFENSLVVPDNTLLYIKNAEYLSLKNYNAPMTGIEVLCKKMTQANNSIVVLSGRSARLTELVRGVEKTRDWFTNVFQFEDLTPEAMMQVMTDYINSKDYMLDPAAEEALKDYLSYAYKLRGSNFRNKYFLRELLDMEIIPRMSERINKQQLPPDQVNLCTIMPEDLPEVKEPNTEEAIRKLDSMTGLENVKKQILDHTALVKMNNLRASKGIFNKMPPMHMVFTGNPGTGKTTIAKHIGEIYHSIGVLSSGHVIETDRTKLVGEYLGVTEKNTLNAIRSASGGVLFIDEAYSLSVQDGEKKDFGMRVIETLLTYLGSDDTDMIVILAGYTQEMQKMLEANPGMKSRFPYIFHFDDYTPEQLMQIGKTVLRNEHYTITPEAERKLAGYVINEYDHKDSHFGNGRFITRLITTQIIPSLSRRLLTKPADEISMEEMTTIQACDIPDIVSAEAKPGIMDEEILAEALNRLNGLVGLQHAKKALTDYVAISRLRHTKGTLRIGQETLCWDFIGKTGTGKSSVAEILGKIQQGLGILKRNHTVCVSIEELAGNDSYQVLEHAIKEAQDGLLFLDMDAPNAKCISQDYLRMWILNKLRELHQTTSLVFAQAKASEDSIAQNLAANGVASYGNCIVFNDFTPQELTEIMVCLLRREYQLEMMPEARKLIQQYVERIKARERKDAPVNARTITHLAQTIAHITQVRIAGNEGKQLVTPQDVSHFKWTGREEGRIGYM